MVPKAAVYDFFVDDDVKIRSSRVFVRDILTQFGLNSLLVKQNFWVSDILDENLENSTPNSKVQTALTGVKIFI